MGKMKKIGVCMAAVAGVAGLAGISAKAVEGVRKKWFIRGFEAGNFIGGLGGRNISAADIEGIFAHIADGKDGVHFLGIGGSDNG